MTLSESKVQNDVDKVSQSLTQEKKQLMERILKVSNDSADKIGKLNGQMSAVEGKLDLNSQWNDRNLHMFDVTDRKFKDFQEKSGE